MKKRFFLIGMALCFLLAAGAARAEQTRSLQVVAKDQAGGQSGIVKLYNKSYAVIIGIDRYKNLPHDRQLKYAVKDARGVEELLRSRYSFNKIITLYDEQATKGRILELLTEELPAQMDREDSLFVFWAGHGDQKPTAFGNLGYLIPHDGTDDKRITRNLTMADIRDTISKTIPAKHVFYVMDACYSGLMTETRALDARPRRDLAYLQEITREPVRQVLTAGSKGQEVLDGGRKGHSVFTGWLIQILEERGDFVTANEIQVIIREKVYNDALVRDHKQKPDFGIFYGNGDFVFIPKIERKMENSQAEIARLQEEMKRLDASEAAAKKAHDERKQREAAKQRRAAEARLKAEQLRQRELREEEARLKKLEEEKARFAEEQKQKELELSQAGREEAQRVARLKAELERRKKAAAVSGADSIDAAVAEIKRLNQSIDEIEGAFRKELNDGKSRINRRYDAEIADVQGTLNSLKPLVKDEFETDSEYRERVAKRTAGYKERMAELERSRHAEISDLERRIIDEQVAQTTDLRSNMKILAEKEYSLDPHDLIAELGMYDVDRQRFPVSLKNKTVTETATDRKGKKRQTTTTKRPGGVLVAVNGWIPLPREEARKFKQEWESGLIRPEVKAKAGSGEIQGVALASDADNDKLLYDQGWFIRQSGYQNQKRIIDLDEKNILDTQTRTIHKLNGRFFDLDHVSMLDTKTKMVHSLRDRFLDLKDGTVLDMKTNLMWAAKDNGADISWENAKSYCENYRGGGYSDWRMPTQDELASLYDGNKKNRHGYHVLTNLIEITDRHPWASGTRGSDAVRFDLTYGNWNWAVRSYDYLTRAIPVRSNK